MNEELNTTSSAREKAELLLSNLEKLKSEVSAIETQYNVLTADYSKICDEAILKISAVKTALEEELSNKVRDLEAVKPEISNLEARFKLGLVPVEAYLKEKAAPPPEGLQAVVNKTADLIEFGLDKIGDGIITLGEKIADVTASISRPMTQK